MMLRRADGGDVDMTGQYNTALSPEDEAKYQAWGQANQRDGRNPAADTYDYDMRGFWQKGDSFAANGHAGDGFKKPNHPTFSNQSQYSDSGHEGGAWGGGKDAPWTFTPSDTNMRYHSAEDLKRYFHDREPGNQLILRAAGGETPIEQPQSPQAQQQYSYFNTMSPEQLQETAIRLGGSAQGQMVQRILAQKRMTPGVSGSAAPHDLPQAFALGGSTPQDGISGFGLQPSPIGDSGFLNTAGGGRTDNLAINPAGESYVVPADVVSGLGEGNSLAGAKAIEQTIHHETGPWGTKMPKPRRARVQPEGFGHAKGGIVMDEPAEKDTVPIVAAGGEYVISPDTVREIGHGDIDRGHDILDKFVLHVRKRTIAEMRKLKGPVKS